MIFIVFLLLILFGFVFLSRKYNNPFTLTFIFGKKGSGKSTLMVKWMLKDLRHGWDVYTDMPDVHVPGVRFFHTSDLAMFIPSGERNAIYLDEVGLSMDNRNFKSFPPGLRDFFALQRKYRCKVICNSQSYDVDIKVRARVDGMILQSNIGNLIGISRPIYRKVTLVEASAQGESRIADNLRFAFITSWRFTWLPRYHRYFESFNAPHRDPIPFKEIPGDLRSLRWSPGKALRSLRHKEVGDAQHVQELPTSDND